MDVVETMETIETKVEVEDNVVTTTVRQVLNDDSFKINSPVWIEVYNIYGYICMLANFEKPTKMSYLTSFGYICVYLRPS